MAKVTKIQAQKRKGRYNVYLDGEYSFPVSETTLVDYRLMNGLELDDAQIKEIKSRENINKAYGDAVNYLSYELRTEKEMRDYLYKKEYSSPVVFSVMERLQKLNYMDDNAYAVSFINTQLNTTANGPKVIRQKMIQKGVPATIIEDKLSEIDQDKLLENATVFAGKQVRKQRHKSFQQMMTKLKQGLYQKGYSGEIISQAIDDLELERDDESETENLQLLVEKVKHRYNNPAKLINYLMTKGYRYDAIKKVLKGE
ncbi:recombination regulator RecX [Companilactobacillus allii]|uniref:Regulatory protein RecX n=1 Tax=Companilactobacillus allii TaxID=1847728 RepID=A0A1P8Q318_9LACO|nr:recombination regulator RecX [Companilactobacillus allii]APX72231.1 recombination regulator RecX [Companilactobacillus allii]USQ69324.1 recombination regulator RecX [Companilactobacillus allii]